MKASRTQSPKGDGLVSSLCLNSGTGRSCFGFTDRHIGHLDTRTRPVLQRRTGRLRERSVLIDRERFTQARRSCLEPAPKRLEKHLMK